MNKEKNIPNKRTFLYGARFHIPRDTQMPAEGVVFPMEVEKYLENCHEYLLTHPYFLNHDFASRVMRERDLNHEIAISDILTAFYSEEKESCLIWLHDKHKRMLCKTQEMQEQLKHMVFREEKSENSQSLTRLPE